MQYIRVVTLLQQNPDMGKFLSKIMSRQPSLWMPLKPSLLPSNNRLLKHSLAKFLHFYLPYLVVIFKMQYIRVVTLLQQNPDKGKNVLS